MIRRVQTNLLLGIGPTRDLHHHVQDCLLVVCVEGNVVEGRDELAILLNVDAVLEGVGSTDLAGGEDGGHGGGGRGAGLW